MAFSKRFVVATHTLVVLSLLRESSVTSEVIAWSVETNPTFVRQVLGELRTAGIVTAQRGPSGGYTLDQDPNEISLLDVFEAIDTDRVLAVPDHEPHPQCPIGNTIRDALRETTAAAEAAVRDALKNETITDLTTEVQSRSTDWAFRSVMSDAVE